MKLKNYQRKAVDELLDGVKKLLSKEGERVCILEAPTGSGKTIMAADFLQQLSSEALTGKYAFMWISAYDLHSQSKEKLEKYLADSVYTFSTLEEIRESVFKENEIVFVNWHSLTKKNREGEWSNVLMRENEDDRNLPTFIQKTKHEGREIILIVDESHHHYWSEQSQELVHDVIAPKVTLEISATPSIKPEQADIVTGDAGYVVVKYEDVVNEGMIKSDIVVNKEIGKFHDLQRSADEAILDASLAQQKHLQELYKKEKIGIRPLILIQLPSEAQTTSDLDKNKLESVETYLADKYDITTDNRRLAIWLSERKVNLENVTRNDSEVDVLIFKQAVALGWDCPRAQILVMFRDIQNLTFEIQTVGRILRMPEAKHYNASELNEAFVYTNLPEIRISRDDESQHFFNVFPSHRESSYKAIDLPSVYLSRVDFGDLTLSFRKCFFEAANKRFGITKNDIGDKAYKKADKDLELYPEELTKPIISNAVVTNIDGAGDVVGDMVEFPVAEADLKHKFEIFAKVSSLPYAPSRSHTKIQQAFYDWFDNFLGYRGKSRAEIQRVVVCSEPNQIIFSQIIEEAKDCFEALRKEELNDKKRIKEYKWNVPAVDYYNERYEKVTLANCVMDPCLLLSDRSKPEQEFEKMLDASGDVSWWYKNRESKETYFAVPYLNPSDGVLRAFYPDYIVAMKDGSIGIYDTKSGITLRSDETTAKSDALQSFFKKHKAKKLHGGIVVQEKTLHKVFVGSKYNPDTDDKNWKPLAL